MSLKKTRNLKHERLVDEKNPEATAIVGRPGSIEQQLDMVENGPLKGDEILFSHGVEDRASAGRTGLRELDPEGMEHNYRIDMSEENREGDEESGNDHSSGYQGADAGMPGEMTERLALRDRAGRKRAS